VSLCQQYRPLRVRKRHSAPLCLLEEPFPTSRIPSPRPIVGNATFRQAIWRFQLAIEGAPNGIGGILWVVGHSGFLGRSGRPPGHLIRPTGGLGAFFSWQGEGRDHAAGQLTNSIGKNCIPSLLRVHPSPHPFFHPRPVPQPRPCLFARAKWCSGSFSLPRASHPATTRPSLHSPNPSLALSPHISPAWSIS